MEKNKILEMARNDSYNGKEFEKRAFEKSNQLSLAILMIIGGVLALVEYAVKKSVNSSLVSVLAAAISVQMICEGIKTKKRSLTILGGLFGILAIIFIVVAVMQVVAK